MPDVLWAALIGGVTGIIAGWGGAYLTARQERQSTLEARWVHRRQEAYVDVLEAADAIDEASRDWWAVASVREEREESRPPAWTSEQLHDWQRAYRRAALIASWRAHALPRLYILNHAIYPIYWATGPSGAHTGPGPMETARRELHEALREFERAARKELDVENEGVMRGWRLVRYRIRHPQWLDKRRAKRRREAQDKADSSQGLPDS